MQPIPSMPNIGSLATAKVEFAGSWIGWDEKNRQMFWFGADGYPEVFGEYKPLYAPNGNDYDIEFGSFGFFDRSDFGNPDPKVRQHYWAEESQTIERRIRTFIGDDKERAERFLPGSKFLGGVTFRPGWISLRAP